MYRRRLTRSLLYGLTIGSILSASACESSIVTDDQVRAYHMALHAPATADASEEIDAYFDYSLGMGEGMKATAQKNQALSDFLRGRSVHYFRVGSTREPEPIADMASPKAILLNMDNFKDLDSRLQRVVEMAVAADTRQSVFVTDFEATIDNKVQTPGAPRPHRIDTKAWAQESFRRWLLAGHRIDVFAHKYRRPDWWFGDGARTLLDNWIYTIVFTPRTIMRDEQRYGKSVLAFMLDEKARRSSPDERHFSYWADDFLVEARNDRTTGNANPDSPVLDIATGAGDPPFDYHVFQSGDLEEWLTNAGDDRRLLNGVRIEPKLAFARSVTLGLEISDVTGALEAFSAAVEPKPVPDTLVDKETGKITLVDPETQKPFVSRASGSKTLATKGDAAPGVFAFVQNAKTYEVGIKLDTAFAAPSAPAVYKADVVVKGVIPNDDPDAASVLALAYSGGFKVSALGESLRLALRDVANAMRGRVLYSSYVIMRP